MQLALACQQSMLSVQHRFLPCSTFTDNQETWVTNVLIMPPRLVHLALFPVTTSPLAGFVTTLIPLPVVVIVTASVKSWKNCVALELKQHRYLRTGVSCCVPHRVLCDFHARIAPPWFCSQLPFPRAAFFYCSWLYLW